MKRSLTTDRIDTVIRFFLYVLIFWLPYSPAVVESCVILCLILWFLKRCILLKGQRPQGQAFRGRVQWLLGGFKPAPSSLNAPIAFFLLACILSVTNSAFFEQSFHGFLTKTLEWFIVYFLIVEAFRRERHIYIALAVFVFTAFSTSLDGLIQFYITHKDIFLRHAINPGDRATAGFKTSNGLGGYLTGFVPALSAWVLFKRHKRIYDFLVELFILFVALWALIVTFSRGAWLGTLMGEIFLLIFVFSKKTRFEVRFSFRFFLGMVFLYGAFLLFFANNLHLERELDRPENIWWRFGIWNIGMEMIKDKPFFGHGINTFMRVFQAYRGSFAAPTYAHNCYIQLAAETGIVGFVCFVWIVIKIFGEALRTIRVNFAQGGDHLKALVLAFSSGVFAFLVHSFFDTQFYSLQLSVYLWFMVGMLVAVCKISDAQNLVKMTPKDG